MNPSASRAFGLAFAHQVLGETRKALDLFVAAVGYDVLLHEAFNNIGRIKLRDETEVGLRCFKLATRLSPRSAMYRHNLGFAQKHAKQYEAALHSARKAMQLAEVHMSGEASKFVLPPPVVESSKMAARLASDLGAWDIAVKLFERAVLVAPGWSEGVYRTAYLRR